MKKAWQNHPLIKVLTCDKGSIIEWWCANTTIFYTRDLCIIMRRLVGFGGLYLYDTTSLFAGMAFYPDPLVVDPVSGADGLADDL